MSLLLPLLILIGALLVLVAEYRLGERPKSRKEKRKRTMILIGSLIVIGAAFFAARDSGIQQGRIETLAMETKALVTGGNSFVWLAAVPMPAQDERFSVFLNHAGDTVPSFDIDIQFQNTGQCDGFPDRTMGNILASGLSNPRNVYIPALSSESVKFLPISLHPTCTDAYYLVLIQTRNRTILQQILLHEDVLLNQIVVLPPVHL